MRVCSFLFVAHHPHVMACYLYHDSTQIPNQLFVARLGASLVHVLVAAAAAAALCTALITILNYIAVHFMESMKLKFSVQDLTCKQNLDKACISSQ
jgi:hypothetical protein